MKPPDRIVITNDVTISDEPRCIYIACYIDSWYPASFRRRRRAVAVSVFINYADHVPRGEHATTPGVILIYFKMTRTRGAYRRWRAMEESRVKLLGCAAGDTARGMIVESIVEFLITRYFLLSFLGKTFLCENISFSTLTNAEYENLAYFCSISFTEVWNNYHSKYLYNNFCPLQK